MDSKSKLVHDMQAAKKGRIETIDLTGVTFDVMSPPSPKRSRLVYHDIIDLRSCDDENSSVKSSGSHESVDKMKESAESGKESAEGGKESAEDGLECGCCFVETMLKDLMQCTEGHLFCRECLAKYAREQVFGAGRATLHCMSTEGECNGKFPDHALRAALPADQLNQLEQRAAMEAARLAAVKLYCCRKCGIHAEGTETKRFACPQPGCGAVSCTNCNSDYHGEGPCVESDEERQRIVEEERQTMALVRACPRCSAEFVKSGGCNKVTCSCGALVCNVCRVEIPPHVGYAHFCQIPCCTHSSCSQCPLFDMSDNRPLRLMEYPFIRRAAIGCAVFPLGRRADYPYQPAALEGDLNNHPPNGRRPRRHRYRGDIRGNPVLADDDHHPVVGNVPARAHRSHPEYGGGPRNYDQFVHAVRQHLRNPPLRSLQELRNTASLR